MLYHNFGILIKIWFGYQDPRLIPNKIICSQHNGLGDCDTSRWDEGNKTDVPKDIEVFWSSVCGIGCSWSTWFSACCLVSLLRPFSSINYHGKTAKDSPLLMTIDQHMSYFVCILQTSEQERSFCIGFYLDIINVNIFSWQLSPIVLGVDFCAQRHCTLGKEIDGRNIFNISFNTKGQATRLLHYGLASEVLQCWWLK